jgi:hypothetical protein
MALAQFRFYEELNDFLPEARRRVDFGYAFRRRAAIKDVIEALGVPHTEVDLILVNGESVDFSYILRDADRVSVYPVFESLDISPITRLRPRPLRTPRFVADAHLGKLARYLRLMGFDTLYRNDYHDHELAEISARERRILLTRDRGLLKRRIVTHGCFIREGDPWQQLEALFQRLDLHALARPYRRCINCNGLLEPVDKARIAHLLGPKTRRYFDAFRRCADCGQIYWGGSHVPHMQGLVARLTARRAGPRAEHGGVECSVRSTP